MTISLLDNEVHIWRVDLQQVPETLVDRYRELMSGEELERNRRFLHKQGQITHAVTRALVRTVLSNYAEVNPADWQFTVGEHGKPELLQAPVPLRFNVSHSSRFVVCAISLKQDVGIDIEHTQRKNDVRNIADRFFSAEEVNALFSLPFEQQPDRFFDYWTLKEAYMKARGEGISLGLGNFTFDVSDRNNIALSVNNKIQEQTLNWYFNVFQLTEQYRIALALRLNNPADPVRLKEFETIPLN